MSAPPWMPLFVAEYLADTGHLSTLEHGAYMLLIMHYWQNDGLPNDDRKLARIARLSATDWRQVRDTVSDLFDDRWRHARIDRERTNAYETMAKRSAAGKRAANARYAKRSSDGPPTPAQKGSGQGHNPDTTQMAQKESSTGTGGAEPSWRIEFTMTFWPAYPHKVGKPKALKAFLAAREVAALDAIMDGLARYVRGKPPDQRWLNPANFLEDERWNDEPAPQPTGPARPHDAIYSALASVVEERARDSRGPSDADGGRARSCGAARGNPIDYRRDDRPIGTAEG